MTSDVLVNGVFANTISIDDRGLNYADGLFETIRIRHAIPEFLDFHFSRLRRSCLRLSLQYDQARLSADVAALIKQASPELQCQSILKIVLTRGVGPRGYSARGIDGVNCIMTLAALPECSVKVTKGVAVRICETRLAINPVLAGMKHLARLENVLARTEWQDEAIAEGIMLDMEGRVVEATSANIFLLSGTVLKTPLLHRCGVAGVVRQVLMDKLASSQGLSVEECDITIDELLAAEGVLLTNSLIGIWPVANIGCHRKVISKKMLRLVAGLEALRGA